MSEWMGDRAIRASDFEGHERPDADERALSHFALLLDIIPRARAYRGPYPSAPEVPHAHLGLASHRFGERAPGFPVRLNHRVNVLPQFAVRSARLQRLLDTKGVSPLVVEPQAHGAEVFANQGNRTTLLRSWRRGVDHPAARVEDLDWLRGQPRVHHAFERPVGVAEHERHLVRRRAMLGLDLIPQRALQI